jgi:hypothetical protein
MNMDRNTVSRPLERIALLQSRGCDSRSARSGTQVNTSRCRPTRVTRGACKDNDLFSFPLTFPRTSNFALRLASRLNGTGSKTVDGRKVVRGFESLPLRFPVVERRKGASGPRHGPAPKPLGSRRRRGQCAPARACRRRCSSSFPRRSPGAKGSPAQGEAHLAGPAKGCRRAPSAECHRRSQKEEDRRLASGRSSFRSSRIAKPGGRGRASPDDRSPMVYECVYSGAVRCARTSRTSWSECVALTTSDLGEPSARLP